MTTGASEDAGLTLPPDAHSAARARRLVRSVLAGPDGESGGGLADEVLADAELCVSELVTNAVLHAGTDMTVSVERSGGRVRITVCDGSPVVPQWVPRSLTAGTGRGLTLITALSDRRGVDVLPDGAGKAVWCELDTAAADGADRAAALDAVLAEEWASVLVELMDEPGAASAPAPAPGEPVRLLRYPLRAGVRMREHREAVLRELRLLELTGAIRDPATAVLAARIGDLLGGTYAGHLSAAEVHKLRALATGHDSIDLEYPRIPDHLQVMEQWRDCMDELDRLGADTGVLTLRQPADVALLWAWVVEEFTRQLRGLPPRPWTGDLG